MASSSAELMISLAFFQRNAAATDCQLQRSITRTDDDDDSRQETDGETHSATSYFSIQQVDEVQKEDAKRRSRRRIKMKTWKRRKGEDRGRRGEGAAEEGET